MLGSSVSGYQSVHVSLWLWWHQYPQSKLAIARPLLPHLLFYKILNDCAICMSYTTENCIPLCPAYMQTIDRWANATQTSSVFPGHSLSYSKQSSTESRNVRSRIFVSSSGSISVIYSNITNVLALKDNVCLGRILQLIFYKLFFINTTHFASVNSYTSSYQLSFGWKLKTGNRLHPSLHPAKALWESRLQALISWESVNSFCSFVSSICSYNAHTSASYFIAFLKLLNLLKNFIL